MLTDPILQHTHATRNHVELVRQGDRERLAGRAHPWHLPVITALTPARVCLGAAIIRLGGVIQGATALPASRRTA